MSPLCRKAQLGAAILLSLSINACGGRTINKNTVLALIADSPLAPIDKKNIRIDSVSQTGARDAVVQTQIKAAFRLEKVQGKWVIEEVRLGDRPWEKMEDLMKALLAVEAGETRNRMEKVALALEAYRTRNGSLPEFRDYVTLSDKLFPDYMNPLIRLDAWQNPLVAYRTGPDGVRILSAGPDGKIGSPDDIELVRTFPH